MTAPDVDDPTTVIVDTRQSELDVNGPSAAIVDIGQSELDADMIFS